MARFKIIIVACGLFGVNLWLHATNINPSVLALDYSQSNNTYNWDNNFNRNFDLGRLKCDLDINANSTLMKKPFKRWQEHLRATFSADYKISSNLSIVPYLSHTRNALQQRIVYTSDIKLATPYTGFKLLKINPFIANKAVKNIGEGSVRVNKGIGYGISSALKPIRLLYNDINMSISYENYDLNKIPFSEFNARLGGTSVWGKSDSLKWEMCDFEGSKKYYSGEDQFYEIIRQVKVERHANCYTRVTLPGELVAKLNTFISFSSYYYSPKRGITAVSQYDNYNEEETYNLQFEKALFNKLNISTGYRWEKTEEDYRGVILDQWTELGELSLKATADIGPNDSLALNIIVGVTSYYGLHGINNNDRDMKTNIFNIQYKHIFNRYFSGELRGGYSNFHQIYTRSINSANNNQNETFLLASAFLWKPGSNINISQGFEIQANYISYDYDRQTINTRNRIFRRGSSLTQIILKLTDKFTVMPGYIYRYEDYGKLFWVEDNWQQATGWDRRYDRIDLKASYHLFPNFHFEPEYVWELKKEFDHAYTKDNQHPISEDIIRKEKTRDLKQTTVITVTWNFSQTEFISASYNRRLWKIRDRDEDVDEFINVSVRYLF